MATWPRPRRSWSSLTRLWCSTGYANRVSRFLNGLETGRQPRRSLRRWAPWTAPIRSQRASSNWCIRSRMHSSSEQRSLQASSGALSQKSFCRPRCRSSFMLQLVGISCSAVSRPCSSPTSITSSTGWSMTNIDARWIRVAKIRGQPARFVCTSASHPVGCSIRGCRVRHLPVASVISTSLRPPS